MCCAFATLVLLGPRVLGAIWWLVNPAYWNLVFKTWVWPLLGLIFLPWTTLMYLLVAPGGIVGFEWVLMALAIAADIASYSGSAYGNRDRLGYGRM
jgi:hypothetical protein